MTDRHGARRRAHAAVAIGATATLLGLGLVPGTARAAAVTVACGDTAGLISAITTANGASSPTVVTLKKGCTYLLTAAATPGGPNLFGDDGLPIITGDITVVNGTIARSAAAATPLFRILEVAKGGRLTLTGVTVTGGSLHAPGAGIAVDGHLSKVNAGTEQPGFLTLDHSTVTRNTVFDDTSGVGTLGGGIFSRGTTTLVNSVVSRNTVSESLPNTPGAEVVAEGGGLINGATMSISHSRIVDNRAVSTNNQNLGAFGGGIGSFSDPDFRNPAPLSISDSVISGNTSTGRYAEGAAMEIEVETVISRSRITDNVATATGDSSPPPCSFGLAQCNSGSAYADGAILNQGHLTLADSLVANNRSSATGSPHALVEGAGITNSGSFNEAGNPWRTIPGKADIIRSVIRDNAAVATGAGSQVLGAGIANTDSAVLTITGSTVTHNEARASDAHGGGIENFVNAILQHPSQTTLRPVTLDSATKVRKNTPDNCEPLGSIPGCSG